MRAPYLTGRRLFRNIGTPSRFIARGDGQVDLLLSE